VSHTLLLADDSLTIQRVVELTFADEDVRVVAVGDGDEAIAVLDRTPPDIVLADVDMPGKTGYEVAQHIKDTPHLAHIPVLLLTGAFEPVDQRRAAEVACDGVLAKPFEPQAVIARVRELLSRPKQARTSLSGSSSSLAGVAAARPAEATSGPSASGEPTPVDEYFERLDQAFAGLSRSMPRERDSPPSAVEPLASPAPHSPMAEAFSAILAAEEATPGSVPASSWTGDAPWKREDLVDEITRRVIDQLSDRLVRERVADVVSRVAERLVREEIERIKRSIS